MRLIALEYHDVVDASDPDVSGFPGRSAGSYKLFPAEFDSHLAALETVDHSRRRTVPLSGSPNGGHQLPVLLTFDDGGRSALTTIAGRLEKWGWRGHFFIATDFIGTPGFLDRAELRELRARGHIVGSHSCSHPLRMSSCDSRQLVREWSASVRMLEDVLREPVTVASVPGGGYSRRVAAAAASAGVLTLFTSEPVTRTNEVDGCTVVGRFTLRTGSPAARVARFAAADRSSRAREWVYWNAKKLAKVAGGSAYLRVRRWMLGRERH